MELLLLLAVPVLVGALIGNGLKSLRDDNNRERVVVLEQKASTWKGASEDDVILSYGTPVREAKTKSGLRVMTFEKSSTHTRTNINFTEPNEYGYSNIQTSSGGSYSRSCKIDFFLKNAKVLQMKFDGNIGKCEGFVKSK